MSSLVPDEIQGTGFYTPMDLVPDEKPTQPDSKSIEADKKLCSVEKCTNKPAGKGLCNMHYKRLRSNGSPDVVWPNRTKPPRTKNAAYSIWLNMRGRCTNSNVPEYKHYGGRGISVCDRWKEKDKGFDNFLEDMGERPEGLTLDRINNDGNYEPSNCRWATWSQQMLNRRHKLASTGLRGIYFSNGKYQARYKINGHPISLGAFADKETAFKVREAFIKELKKDKHE